MGKPYSRTLELSMFTSLGFLQFVKDSGMILGVFSQEESSEHGEEEEEEEEEIEDDEIEAAARETEIMALICLGDTALQPIDFPTLLVQVG